MARKKLFDVEILIEDDKPMDSSILQEVLAKAGITAQVESNWRRDDCTIGCDLDYTPRVDAAHEVIDMSEYSSKLRDGTHWILDPAGDEVYPAADEVDAKKLVNMMNSAAYGATK